MTEWNHWDPGVSAAFKLARLELSDLSGWLQETIRVVQLLERTTAYGGPVLSAPLLYVAGIRNKQQSTRANEMYWRKLHADTFPILEVLSALLALPHEKRDVRGMQRGPASAIIIADAIVELERRRSPMYGTLAPPSYHSTLMSIAPMVAPEELSSTYILAASGAQAVAGSPVLEPV